MDKEQLDALNYHKKPKPGKIATHISKSLKNRYELGLAYTPGVAIPCIEIHKNAEAAYFYTSKWNSVAVISNGTAVLGLGDIGALAGKPVMEGKAVLFKYLAGIDAVDVEVNHKEANKLIEFLKAIASTYGGINLEDVAAPTCFEVDDAVHNTLGIPFFHDDQSGTAVVVAAAIKSALKTNGKDLSKIKFIVSGAGAAALSCIDLLVHLGAELKNFSVFDSKGLLHLNRDLEPHKVQYAQENEKSIKEALIGADVFLGLSRANVLTKEDIMPMAAQPIILAMANPTPEIMPDIAKQARPDAIVGSGRSDFPNQVNNVLCFPFLFRGALDSRAKTITLAMQLACCDAIMKVASESRAWGPEKIMPDAFDPTLIYEAPAAIAAAAHAEKNASKALPENYNTFLDDLLYGETLEANFIPTAGNDKAQDLIRILEKHGLEEKSHKKLLALSIDEIIAQTKEIESYTAVFSNIKIGFNNKEPIQCTDLAKLIKETRLPFIGLILEDKLLFNEENRIWYANKLCMKD